MENFQWEVLFSEKSRLADEGPIRKVKVDSFWMAKYETTWDLFNLFVSRNLDDLQPNYDKKSEVNIDVDAISGATTPYVEMSFGMGVEGYPAISMTQLAAKKFSKWLSAMTGNFTGFLLKQNGNMHVEQFKYILLFLNDSKELDKYAWYDKNSQNKYHKVGQKLPNKWGLHDMHGNVSEWTLDAYNPSFYSQENNIINNNPYNKPIKLLSACCSWRFMDEFRLQVEECFKVRVLKTMEKTRPSKSHEANGGILMLNL